MIYPHPFILLKGENLEDAIINHNPSESIYSLFPQLKEVHVVVGTPYVDMGAEVFDMGQLLGNPPTLEVVELVDTSTPTPPDSPFIVQYIATNHLGLKSTAERYVHVIGADLVSPVILLIEDDPLNPTDSDWSVFEVEVGSEWKDTGYIAYDNVDGLISHKVEVSGDVDTERIGEYTVVYTVTDNAENMTMITRTVKVQDSRPPQFFLNGLNPYIIPCYGEYLEFGANAIDEACGNLPVIIETFNDSDQQMQGVCVCQAGIYRVRYSATDLSGNIGFWERLVVVQGECNQDCHFYPLCFTNIEENTLYKNIEVYPNPTQNQFFVNFNDLAHLQYKAKIQVYDIAGQLVSENPQAFLQKTKIGRLT